MHKNLCKSSGISGLFFSCFDVVILWPNFSPMLFSLLVEIAAGHFRFQQHYVILMLTVSLLYAALVHPRETHQIVYGLAYLFIFPAMHLLLPIYSIANIIDQSWGTRDSVSGLIGSSLNWVIRWV